MFIMTQRENVLLEKYLFTEYTSDSFPTGTARSVYLLKGLMHETIKY